MLAGPAAVPAQSGGTAPRLGLRCARTARGPIGDHGDVSAPLAGSSARYALTGAPSTMLFRSGAGNMPTMPPPCRRTCARGCCGGRADPGDTGMSAEGGKDK
jgi:hypothetical protein